VLTDTVGFIRDLPHGLIESFKSTLADTVQADLLVHLLDISSSDCRLKKKVVMETLEEIGAADIPLLLCFNKIDDVDEEIILEYRLEFPEALFISALKNEHIGVLKSKLQEHYHLKICPETLERRGNIR
jgi:GTP-binding protein HflX